MWENGEPIYKNLACPAPASKGLRREPEHLSITKIVKTSFQNNLYIRSTLW